MHSVDGNIISIVDDIDEKRYQWNRTKLLISFSVFALFLVSLNLIVLTEVNLSNHLLEDHYYTKFRGLSPISTESRKKPINSKVRNAIRKMYRNRTNNEWITSSSLGVSSFDGLWNYLDNVFSIIRKVDCSSIYEGCSRLEIDVSNHIAGSIRLQIFRVRDRSCSVSPPFSKYFISCFSSDTDFSNKEASYVEKEPYGVSADVTTFTYTEHSGLNFHGNVYTLPMSGGYTELVNSDNWISSIESENTNININKREVTNYLPVNGVLRKLKEEVFIDITTRALVLTINIWNVNTGKYSVVLMLFELSPTGMWKSSLDVSLLPNRYINPFSSNKKMDFVVFIAELLMPIFVLYFIGEEIIEFVNGKQKYITDPWNLIDWLNLLFLFVSFSFRVNAVVKASNLGLDPNSGGSRVKGYINLTEISNLISAAQTMNSVNILFLWLKSLKYLNASLSPGKLIVRGVFKSVILSFGFLISILVICFSLVERIVRSDILIQSRVKIEGFSSQIFYILLSLAGLQFPSHIYEYSLVLFSIFVLLSLCIVFFCGLLLGSFLLELSIWRPEGTGPLSLMQIIRNIFSGHRIINPKFEWLICWGFRNITPGLYSRFYFNSPSFSTSAVASNELFNKEKLKLTESDNKKSYKHLNPSVKEIPSIVKDVRKRTMIKIRELEVNAMKDIEKSMGYLQMLREATDTLKTKCEKIEEIQGSFIG